MVEQLVTKIMRVRDAPQLNMLGGVDAFKAIDFTVDGHDMHTVVISTAEFTAEKARAKVEEQASIIRALLR